MALTIKQKLLCLVLYICIFIDTSKAQLQVGFYNLTCPQAEAIVRQQVSNAVASDPGIAAGLLRLHFHDCFVRGCDASVMLASYPWNQAEMDAIPNQSLRGFEIIWYAKWQLEQVCQGIVSCADIIAFAARDSVSLTGGITYDVPSGRRDGTISRASEALANLPPPFADENTLTQMFANKGLSQDDMVTLSGAHTIGQAHCSSFSSRLNNFSPNSSTDPTLDSTLASELTQQCPQNNTDPKTVVSMDPVTPNTFDVNYYKNILANKGLFTSDQTLMSINATSAVVKKYAQDSATFMSNFAAAMVKMGNIDVLTGTNGEIRTWCHVTN
ncbi:Peroxidase [Rhynchospora pubera]|uniref:Peroxidase n=1 Tax=Rhynchospora pubera TaxID=906938 RepID=A0AAV8GHV7_9POAL|nr:Peroxidase [Rhynchospora pubera]